MFFTHLILVLIPTIYFILSYKTVYTIIIKIYLKNTRKRRCNFHRYLRLSFLPLSFSPFFFDLFLDIVHVLRPSLSSFSPSPASPPLGLPPNLSPPSYTNPLDSRDRVHEGACTTLEESIDCPGHVNRELEEDGRRGRTREGSRI